MEPAITVTGANLKALTHPLRVQVLGLLRTIPPPPRPARPTSRASSPPSPGP
ncbi:MAG TPA: hypothetical protein VM428_05050 [Microlunatus sp.]|nr:hypothetical protein [Microlunatus sp.]